LGRIENSRGRAATAATAIAIVALLLAALAFYRSTHPAPGVHDQAREIARSVGLVWYHSDTGWVSYGTAFAVDGAGHFLTCAHVVHGVQQVTVAVPSLEGELNLPAQVLAEDLNMDVALLHVEGADRPAVRIGSSAAIPVGEAIGFFGFPLGYTVSADLVPSLAVGHVSALPEWRVNPGGPRVPMLQIDASVAAGQSGSPLFRRSTGEVIGMVKSHIHVPGTVLSREELLEEIESIPDEIAALTGIGLAIPMDGLRPFLEANGVTW